MDILKRLFGKAGKQQSQPKTYMEKDNNGTRQDTQEKASAYWNTRFTSSSMQHPFVLYTFDKEEDARGALLELPCIHIAEDSGKLICTEVLSEFGYYETEEGKYNAIVCGTELTHELWSQAKASFIKHGGKPKGQGDLEPEKGAATTHKAKPQKRGKVVFVREDRKFNGRVTFVYRIHKGPDAETAKAFLEQNPVTKQHYYLVVETPQGNYCRDIDGMYTE
jgi:DNA polymerase IIIc chi subunit